MLEDFQTMQDVLRNSSEDGIIPDCPNTPAHNDNDLHEEWHIQLTS